MLQLRGLRFAAGLALVLGLACPGALRAEDPPAPTPAPAPDPQQTEESKRAEALEEQAEELERDGILAEATLLAREGLAIREKAFGIDHLALTASLNRLAMLLQDQGLYAEAQPLVERALGISERALGKGHLDVAPLLSNLAGLLKAQGHYVEARPLFERALAIWAGSYGEAGPEVAMGLNSLGSLLTCQGAFVEARPLFERALAIQARELGKDSLDVVPVLNNLARLLQAQGSYAEARPLFERALAIREKLAGKDHPATALSLNNLAVLLQDQGVSGRALPLFERALAIWEGALGKGHPNVAMVLSNLACLFQDQGAYAEARAHHERALSILEGAYGAAHPEIATSLNNLATLLQSQGVLAEARPLYERALAIFEGSLGMAHPTVATSLCNLASLLRAQGAYAEARRLLERALAIDEHALGKDNNGVAGILNNLGGLFQAEGAYGQARPLYERALAIREKALGAAHPLVATSLDNLASLDYDEGAYGAARPLHARALAIREHAFGRDHPDVGTSLSNLAVLLRKQGDYSGALPLYQRALTLTEARARAQLGALSSRQRLQFLRTTRYQLDNWLGLAPLVGLTGYAEVLRFRGLVARVEAAERLLARHADADDLRLLDQLQAAQHVAARLSNQVPPATNGEARAAWQLAYATATADGERLALEFAARLGPSRAAYERLDLGLEDVQGNLAEDAALVDLLRVADHYLAFVVARTGAVVRVDLGEAATIERVARAFVTAIQRRDAAPWAPMRGVVMKDGAPTDNTQTWIMAGRELRELVFAPIQARLAVGVKRLYLVPDAALAAVPFAALPGHAQGQLLLDEVRLAYLAMAQDLVPWREAGARGAGAVLVGGVDYEHAAADSTEPVQVARAGARALEGSAPRGERFLALAETRPEVEALRTRLGPVGVTLFLGTDATEAALRSAVGGRRYLHIATHGFAREDLLAGLYDRKLKDAWTSASMERQLAAGHDPMLLSGLALAGANPREGGNGDDGILTALEASYLDLDGVDLVTLSACDTAKGTVESGEGVLGLVSAFQMAGARHVMASLWSVDDEATRLLMEGVYERLLRKESPLAPADALREAALALRDRKEPDGTQRFAAPRYWAAFVAYGR